MRSRQSQNVRVKLRSHGIGEANRFAPKQVPKIKTSPSKWSKLALEILLNSKNVLNTPRLTRKVMKLVLDQTLPARAFKEDKHKPNLPS